MKSEKETKIIPGEKLPLSYPSSPPPPSEPNQTKGFPSTPPPKYNPQPQPQAPKPVKPSK